MICLFVFRICIVCGFEEEDSFETLHLLSCFVWLKPTLFNLLCFWAAKFAAMLVCSLPLTNRKRLAYEVMYISTGSDVCVLIPMCSHTNVYPTERPVYPTERPVCPHTFVFPYRWVPVPKCSCTDVPPYLCVGIPKRLSFRVRYGDTFVQGYIGTGIHRYRDT